ncbi:MAG: ATP-dependent DNA helicase PcrA [Clostridia bacterium 41_269]|nr:MAG: ATP-dependent DNA helicase PcrA [Clostridia bacterium 41_269]
MVDKEFLFKNLNPQQIEAVKYTDGPLLILAGAGSGKTRVLTYKIAYLISEKGIKPEDILAITFTNKAAEEMKERLEKLLDIKGHEMWVSTFHSACVRILRRHINQLGLKNNFVIYDDTDQRNLLKNIIKELNLDEKKFSVRKVQEIISRVKNQLCTPEIFAREVGTYYDTKIADIYRMYQERLKENNGLDFDDLLMQTVYLLSSVPEVLKYYQEKFKYILVDEYQDTNYAQYVLIKLLGEKHRKVCVVGDDDQSIYGWRGADITNILNFENDFPEAKIIKLEQNYRSTKNILKAANEVVKNNRGRKGKTLWTDNPEGEKVKVFEAYDEKSEAKFLSREIRKLMDQGIKLGDIAVLYRTNSQSRIIEECFIEEGIPYIVVGGLKFYERKEIKDIIAYLRVLTNPNDSLSMERIINVPRRGIGHISWAKITGYARQEGIPILQALIEAENISNLGRARDQVIKLGKILNELREEKDTFTVTKITEELLSRTGYIDALEREGTEEAYTRIENIREFLSVTQEYDRNNINGSLEDFLERISLISDVDLYSSSSDYVTLMTLHAAKGLEFPVVFITGMEEGIFPHARALDSEPEVEEERRLCYVGMTRAMKKLYLTYARSRTIYGGTFISEPSRFINEISPQLIEKIESSVCLKEDQAGHDHNSNYSSFGRGNNTDTLFSIGDKLYHEKWGIGTVVKVEGPTEQDIISVAFEGKGIKKLIPAYAPLKKL